MSAKIEVEPSKWNKSVSFRRTRCAQCHSSWLLWFSKWWSTDIIRWQNIIAINCICSLLSLHLVCISNHSHTHIIDHIHKCMLRNMLRVRLKLMVRPNNFCMCCPFIKFNYKQHKIQYVHNLHKISTDSTQFISIANASECKSFFFSLCCCSELTLKILDWISTLENTMELNMNCIESDHYQKLEFAHGCEQQ